MVSEIFPHSFFPLHSHYSKSTSPPMAMAYSFTASSISFPYTKSSLLFPSSSSSSFSFPLKHHRDLPLSLTTLSLSAASATSTTAIEIDNSQLSSKTLPFRVGHGFDLHRLEPGYPLIIGGISIPHDRGCEAHSDGDVLLHCVVDAILGSLGLPDIGQIFPDSDPKWKGCDSSVFIHESVRLMHEAGYDIGNLDATLILQRPKVKKVATKSKEGNAPN